MFIYGLWKAVQNHNFYYLTKVAAIILIITNNRPKPITQFISRSKVNPYNINDMPAINIVT